MDEQQQPTEYGHGGKRQGSGRKFNADRRPTLLAIEDAEFKAARVKAVLLELRRMALNKPEKVITRHTDDKGRTREVEQWVRPYDGKVQLGAATDYLNRAIGKPVERVQQELSGPDGGGFVIQIVERIAGAGE